MIKIEYRLIDELKGYQFLFINELTQKTLYLVCPIDSDLDKFANENLKIAEVETL